MKKQILVDMDGVLADVFTQYINCEFIRTGKLIKMQDLYGKAEGELPYFLDHVKSVGFFCTAPLMADCVEGLRFLNDRFNVLIVSSATEFPLSLTEKQAWLNKYFPFISWKQMIFCGKKDSIKGDIMIDDHPKNLNYFGGTRIMFTQPHNIESEVDNCLRVSNWREIMNLECIVQNTDL